MALKNKLEVGKLQLLPHFKICLKRKSSEKYSACLKIGTSANGIHLSPEAHNKQSNFTQVVL